MSIYVLCASLDQITVKIWILGPNNPQKSPKSPISQFAILRKWTLHFFLLLRHFSIFSHEIFRRQKRQKFFGGLNLNSVNKISAKSSYLAILKISCKNIEKWRRSRKKCKVHFRKIARTETLAILGIFEGYLGGKWAWPPRRRHIVYGLQTQPKSWLTGYTFRVDHYLEIVFSKISVVNPPPPPPPLNRREQ